MDGDNREHASEENGDTEVQEQYEEENGDNLEEAPQTNVDQENMQNCDLFGELKAPADDEAQTEEAQTEEAQTEEADNTAEDDNNEQEDATESTEKPAEENADENQEKKEAETTGDSGEPGDDAKLQPGTKTNSDRQQDIFSRVFVGHLPTDRCSREDVEKLFSEYGEITGCSVLNGYGFVQYREPDSVDSAIKHLHGHHFFGANIVVDKTDAARQALGEKPQKRPPGRRGGYGGRQGNYQPPPRSHGYRDYGPPPYHPRGYGPPPNHYDHRDSYYQPPPPQRRGPPQHGYGYHRPRDDYYDSRPYDYHDY